MNWPKNKESISEIFLLVG